MDAKTGEALGWLCRYGDPFATPVILAYIEKLRSDAYDATKRTEAAEAKLRELVPEGERR